MRLIPGKMMLSDASVLASDSEVKAALAAKDKTVLSQKAESFLLPKKVRL